MFSPNPDEIIKTNFKIFGRKKKPRSRPDEKIITVPAETKPLPATAPTTNPHEGPNNNELFVEEILVHKVSSESVASTKHSLEESQSISQGTSGSVYVLVEQSRKDAENKQNGRQNNASPPVSDDEDGNRRTASSRIGEDDTVSRREKRFAKRKLVDDDRRRNAWIPCTCPQYKVSKELATKWDLQGIFFGKVLVVKVLQLLVINLVIFASVFESESTLPYFKQGHDWVYLAYGLFAILLVCIRWIVGYRSRWPKAASFILMIPLTIIIAFMCACIATIYNSIVIPLVSSTIFLTFIMLCFEPYLLRKSVMHRTTNLAGSGLALLSSLMLLFLKEFERQPMTYWDFISHVWLPGVILSQIAVQITILEIQRMIFGLCFNVSTKRWHVAALYL